MMGFTSKALHMLAMLQLLAVTTFTGVAASTTDMAVASCVEHCWTTVGDVANCGLTKACICPDPQVYSLLTTCLDEVCGLAGDRTPLDAEMACEDHAATFEGERSTELDQDIATTSALVARRVMDGADQCYETGENCLPVSEPEALFEAKDVAAAFKRSPVSFPDVVDKRSPEAKAQFGEGWCARFTKAWTDSRCRRSIDARSAEAVPQYGWCARFSRAWTDTRCRLSANDKRSADAVPQYGWCARFTKAWTDARCRRSLTEARSALPPRFGFCGAPGASCAGAGVGAGIDNSDAKRPVQTAAVPKPLDKKEADQVATFGFCGAKGASCAGIDGEGEGIVRTIAATTPTATTFVTSTYVALSKRNPNPQLAQLLSVLGRTTRRSPAVFTPPPAPKPVRGGGGLPDSFGFCGAAESSCGFDIDAANAARNATNGNSSAVHQK
ncbi:hypothetical protein MBLNU230_g6847t1 [Neophaeotheca triangularis]